MVETPDQAWVRDLAQRIKKLQTSFADDDGSRRKALIRKEVRDARSSMSQTEWKPKFEMLKAHFSAWEEPRTQVVKVTEEKPVELTPKQMVDKLVVAYPNLKEKESKQFAQELKAVGYQLQSEEKTPETTTPDRFQLPDSTATMLDFKMPPTVFPTPVFLVLDGLMKALLELNESAIEVQEHYKQFTPPEGGIGSSHYGKMARVSAEDLKQVLHDYLAGDPATGEEQVWQVLAEVQKLLEGFIHAPGSIREKLSEELKKCLAPDKIKMVVQAAVFPKGAYWDRYEALWKSHGYGKSNFLDSAFWGREYSRAFLSGFEDGASYSDD